MKKILAISGSASANSSNLLLLKALQIQFSNICEIEVFEKLRDFPLFRPEDLKGNTPDFVVDLRNKIVQADAILIATPEYTHNIPAVLKNAIEWLTESGELTDKKVLPITFTPHEPRGKWAMESLLSSLQALNMQVVSQVALHKTDVKFENNKLQLSADYSYLMEEAIKLLL